MPIVGYCYQIDSFSTKLPLNNWCTWIAVQDWKMKSACLGDCMHDTMCTEKGKYELSQEYLKITLTR